MAPPSAFILVGAIITRLNLWQLMYDVAAGVANVSEPLPIEVNVSHQTTTKKVPLAIYVVRTDLHTLLATFIPKSSITLFTSR